MRAARSALLNHPENRPRASEGAGCAGADAAGANRSVSVRVARMKLPLVKANTPPNTTLSASAPSTAANGRSQSAGR